MHPLHCMLKYNYYQAYMLYKYNNGGKYLKDAGCFTSVECPRARGRGQRSGCTEVSVGTTPAYDKSASQIRISDRSKLTKDN